MSVSSSSLLDTNVLVYGYYQQSPQHAACRALLDQAKQAGAGLCVAPLSRLIWRPFARGFPRTSERHGEQDSPQPSPSAASLFSPTLVSVGTKVHLYQLNPGCLARPDRPWYAKV